MANPDRQRRDTWASNGNIAVYIFFTLFTAWMLFQVWARLPGGQPAPVGLDPMVMAALGVAITAKSVEKRQRDDELRRELDDLRSKQDEGDDKS